LHFTLLAGRPISNGQKSNALLLLGYQLWTKIIKCGLDFRPSVTDSKLTAKKIYLPAVKIFSASYVRKFKILKIIEKIPD